MSVFSTLERWRQEYDEFKTSLNYEILSKKEQEERVVFQSNGIRKQADIAILISEKIDF